MRIAAACSVPLKRHISAWNGGLCRKHLMRASTALVRSLEFSAGLGVSPKPDRQYARHEYLQDKQHELNQEKEQKQ